MIYVTMVSDLPMILRRVVSSGPFLYLGLMMILDPAKVERGSRIVNHHIQNFEQALRVVSHARPF